MSAKVPLEILLQKEANLQEEIGRLLEAFTSETGFAISKVSILKHKQGEGYSVRVNAGLEELGL